jgi:hypothetical protein
MGRKAIPRMRIGAYEKGRIGIARRKLKEYRIFWSQRHEGETALNKLLIDHLRQQPSPLHVENSNIPCAQFFKEKFRPEAFFETRPGKKLFAIECKRLTQKSAKGRWKEGLSQALLYATSYKHVFLVLFDFTKTNLYHKAFGKGNTSESRFAAKLRRLHNLDIIVAPHVKK